VEHEADHLLHRLSLSGISIPSRDETKMDLALTAGESREADVWLSESVPLLGSGPLVGFGPGSKWPSKVWPEERFVEVGNRLIQKQNIYPIVFGGAEDRALGERLILAWKRGANAAGELPVRQAAAALAQCRFYVGNDTGTMHLAAAVEIPCVAIMSALDWPGHWNPYGAGHTVLRRSVPCEGCLLKVCERERMRCLKEITVEDVVNACGSVLRAKDEGERAESERPRLNCSLPAVGSEPFGPGNWL
jgi:heptosyltransferase-2